MMYGSILVYIYCIVMSQIRITPGLREFDLTVVQTK